MKLKFTFLGLALLGINIFVMGYSLMFVSNAFFGTNFIVLSKEFGIWILFVGLIIMFVNNILNKKENKNETKRRNNK